MNESQQRIFWWTVVALAGFHLVSWIAYHLPGLQPWVFGGLGGVGLWIAWQRPAWIAYASIGELVIGGQGYLVFTEVSEFRLTLRMLLFGLTGIAALRVAFSSGQHFRWPRWLWPAAGLLAVVTIMTVVGLAKGFGLATVFSDTNGYLYLGILWFWWLILRSESDWKPFVLVILLAGVVVIGLKTWLTMTVFSQQLAVTGDWYHWIRNTGAGEITYIQGNIWRVFFQSHLYSTLGALIVLGGFLTARAPRWWLWPLVFGAFGFSASLSRSLWIGAAVAVIALLVLVIQSGGWRTFLRLWVLIPVGAAVWLMTLWTLQWPYILPPAGEAPSNPVTARFADPGTTQAADARREQLQPLWQTFRSQPIFGHGFGKSVTYYSPDPRIQGQRTTTAFELGYLDQAVKFGLLGLATLGWLLLVASRGLWLSTWKLILLPSLLAVVVIHAASPYLNHPLGLGWVGLMVLYAYAEA